MKMKHGAAAAAIIGALALPGAAFAQDAFATTDLNMRAGPGPEFPVVGAIGPDEGVDILGCTESGLWCDVTAGAGRGWAYAEYLSFDLEGERVIVPNVGTRVEVPTASYQVETYWDENYRDRPFYGERERYMTTTTTATTDSGGSAGAASGLAGGAATGAVLGGPVGAIIGGVAGATLGAAIDPPERVRTYVAEQEAEPVLLEGEVVVGAELPEVVEFQDVPDYEYRYAIVNGQRVLVEPGSRRVVYIQR
jgi:uncharacterized protein YraI